MTKNALGVEVPAQVDAFDPATDMAELGISLAGRVVVPVANATARDALATALSAAGHPASLTEPIFAYRSDTDVIERNVGSGWAIFAGDPRRILGETYTAGSVVLPVAISDLLTVTFTMPKTGYASMSSMGTVTNGGSGADRQAALQVDVDGANVLPAVLFTLPFGAGGNRGVGFAFQGRPNLAAGSHTITLRGSASAAGAVQMQGAGLVVEIGGRVT